MVILIDLDLQQAVDSFGSRSPAQPIQVKAQDTPSMAVYFTRRGTIFDLGASPGLRFGLFVTGNPNPLVQYSAFTKIQDVLSRTCYVGYPNFNTTALAQAIGTNASLSCLGEIRYQTSTGTIARTLDISFTVLRGLLNETILDSTTAAFTVPAVGSNVTIQITNTSWLSAGLNLTIGNGAGAYQVVSITDASHFLARNQGGAGNAAPATNIPSGTSVGIAQSPALPTYPDPSIIELTTRKGVANGYAGLDANTLVLGSRIPVDGQTISVLGSGKIGSSSILTTVATNFTTAAANATVSVNVASTSGLIAGQYVRIPIAGYYVVQSITDAAHVVLQNNGDPFNAAAGVTVTAGAVLLPAQAAAGGAGSAGQNAYTTTSASFTVPASGTTVSVTLGSTSWLGGSGYIVFIAGAGYYAVSSITDTTHAVLTNLGYAATNAASGTVIATGARVSPGGVAGAATTGSPGANAYDALAASFTMPAANASVSIVISNTSWLGVGQEIYIAGAGYFSVSAISSPTVLVVTNSNYPGAAAPGSTIAVGAKVSSAGLIGPTGAGGAGLNAFTTLSASFVQPASGSTVVANVGTTAWMATGQIVYVAGGGYYSVSSIADLTHATLNNLGYSGNLASGSTVASAGAVTPAGLIGPSGSNPYTTTTASFTMPAVGNSVTVTVGSTAFMTAGHNLFIQGAGYFIIATVTDGTHVVITNAGATGNVASGNTIASSAGVVTAGATGPQGLPGSGSTVLADAQTAVGLSWINNPTGILKRIVQGANITLTDGGDRLTVAAASGGAGVGQGYWDPANGLFFQDDFTLAGGAGPLNDPKYLLANGTGATFVGSSTYGQNSTLKVLGAVEFNTGTNASNTGAAMTWGGLLSPDYGSVVYNLGAALTFKTRVFLEATLPATGGGYALRAGIARGLGTLYFNPPVQGFYFEYSPDNNSGQWRVAVGGASPTYTNTSVAAAADTAYDLEIDVNAAWNSVTFLINGTTVATVSSGIPTAYGFPLWQYAKGSAGTVAQKAAVDSWMIYYPVTR
jgi:hypothetical protein